MKMRQEPSICLAVCGALLLASAATALGDKEATVESPASPKEAAAAGFRMLENDVLSVAISPRTGAVAGMWDLRLDKRVVEGTNDLYRIETRKGTSESKERFDRVASIERKGEQEIVVRCRNRLLPDLLVTKTYRFGDSPQELSKTVTFQSRTDGGYFVEYFTQLTLDSAFRKGGRFDLHAADYLGPGEPTFDHRGHNRVVAQYRYRINGRYVTTVTGFNFSDEDRYTDTGWVDPVFADYLDKATKASAEVRTLVLAGDEFDYYTYYDHLPEVEKVYDIDVSEWFWKQCRMDAMYLSRNNLESFGDMPCMTTRWNLNLLWGDYFSKGELVIGSRDKPRPTIPAEKVAAENYEFIKSAPNWRMSMYTWLWTIAHSSRTFAEHPEFVVTTREGEFDRSTWRHDVTGDPSYLKQLRAPGCQEYFLDQYRQYARKMGVQFVYIDGCPIGISRLDWKLNTVQQTYDWLDYFRRIRRIIRSVHPDGFLFVNNPNQPFTDGGYLEDHEMVKHIKADWRAYAHRLMVMKYRERPKRWHALLYWTEASKPLYSNYTLGLGFTYSNGGTEWHATKLRAYVNAAWELRGSRMVMAVESPRFWREPTDFEVYSLRKGGEGLVSIINHKDKTTVVPVRLSAAKMGLVPDKPVHVWQLRMRDTRGAKAWKKVPTQCFEKIYLGAKAVRNGELALSVESRPLLLELLVLTQAPIWFTDVGCENLRTVQNNLLTASITDLQSAPGTFRVEVEKGPATLFVLNSRGREPSVLLDNAPCQAQPAKLGNAEGLAVRVPQGTHVLTLKRKPQ